jgi:hypothetical protein
MKGISAPVKILMAVVVLMLAAAIIASILTGQNQNFVDFGTQAVSGTMNNSTG